LRLALAIAAAAAAGCVDVDFSDTSFACNASESCPPGFACDGARCIRTGDGGSLFDGAPARPRSCLDLRGALPDLDSGVYALDPDGFGAQPEFSAYCEMTLDGGGWTLAMKLDGTQTTFGYDSPHWTRPDPVNESAAELDASEAKLASFSTVAFTQIRVGMVDGAERWLVIDTPGESLLSLFDGGFVQTQATRAGWIGMLAAGSLQANCNREGINNGGRVRLGIVANDQGSCTNPESLIGFGLDPTCGGASTTGNVACNGALDGDRDTAVLGYVFVR
jgi:hypothetical protein